MRKVLIVMGLVGTAVVAWSGTAGGDPAAMRVPEPAGVIRMLRVVASGGTHAEVTGVIPGVASVDISTPHAPDP